MAKAYYTEEEAAEKLGITPEELAGLVRDNKLRARRDGNGNVFSSEEVDALAGGGRNQTQPSASEGIADAISLAEADEAMMAGFGGGSGLLELTRERYETSLGDVRYNIPMEATVAGALAPGADVVTQAWMTVQEAATALGVSPRSIEDRVKAGELHTRSRPDGRREVLVAAAPTGADEAPVAAAAKQQLQGQFGVAGASLGMAERLTRAQEAELKRTRNGLRLAYLVIAVLVAAGAAALWWAMDRTRQLDVQRAGVVNVTEKLTDAQGLLTEEKARVARLNGEIQTLRADVRDLQADKDKLQADTAAAREQLAASKAAVEILGADLKAARASAEQLQAELARAKATTQPATRSRPGGS